VSELEPGQLVRTPEGWTGRVLKVRRQEVPHGGPRVRAGLGPKRARPGELEAALAELRVYAVVEVGVGKVRTYDVETLQPELAP
jgi:hypothetical protein